MERFVLGIRVSSIFVAGRCGERWGNRMFYIPSHGICISKPPMFWYHYGVWSGQVWWDYLINNSSGLWSLTPGISHVPLVLSVGFSVNLHHNRLLASEPQTNALIRSPVAKANLVGDYAARRSLNSLLLAEFIGHTKPVGSMWWNLIQSPPWLQEEKSTVGEENVSQVKQGYCSRSLWFYSTLRIWYP